MLCPFCNKNEATIHFRNEINGMVNELHICPACATQKGLVNTQTEDGQFGIQLPMGSLMDPKNSFLGLVQQLQAEAASSGSPTSPAPEVKSAGDAIQHLTNTGRFREAKDYGLLHEQLAPLLKQMHAGSQHRGKSPLRFAAIRTVDALREKLTLAVEQEEYEEAAAIRDQIRQLEAQQEKPPADAGGSG